MKIPRHLHIPAAIVLGCGLVAVGLAYGLSDDSARAPIVAGVSVVWGVIQSLLPKLITSSGES